AASVPFTEAMRWVGILQGTAGMLAMTAVAAALLWRAGQRRAVPVLLLCVPGGMLLNVAVKHAVHRPRPDWGYALQMPASFSFPSGHVAGATLFYGVAVVWLWPRLRTGWARGALSIAAVSMVLLVALSRIVLGVHYASDCVGAVLEGLLWLAICAPWAHAAGAAAVARRDTP
ncbi:MAG: phosphatase PAP2 family protein, partial [Burkholderiales bacterium]|nr:phosphatase PAP2 family protein [Burkholderiales bacterium]